MKEKLLILLLLISFRITAQDSDNRYTEEEIEIQDKFVEAKKHLLIGRLDKAEEILKKLYGENRKNPTIALELSKIYHLRNDAYNEYKYAQKATEYAPNNEYVLSNYAMICIEQEKHDEGFSVLKQLVKIDASSEEYADALATVYLIKDDKKAAIAVYDKLESVIGINEQISHRKFEIYELLNDSKQASQELLALSEAFPNDVRFLKNLAAFYNKNSLNDKALDTYKIILALDVNDATANMAISKANAKGGKDNNYLLSLSPIINNKSIPVDTKILELVPYVQKANENNDKELIDALITLSDKIALNHPKEAKAYALKGDIFVTANRYKDATKAYEKTLTINNNVYTVWEGLMDVLNITEAYPKLKDVATQALDLYPNKASAYQYYGRAYAMTGEIEEAIDILSDGLMVSGKNLYYKSNMYAELGRAYALKGDPKKAISNVEKALELSDNKSGYALEAMGDILLKKGEKKDALKFWKKAQQVGIDTPVLMKKIKG
ncbi:MAG: tetratricopeptide repeat protein [Saprospiraceae bacterium]